MPGSLGVLAVASNLREHWKIATSTPTVKPQESEQKTESFLGHLPKACGLLAHFQLGGPIGRDTTLACERSDCSYQSVRPAARRLSGRTVSYRSISTRCSREELNTSSPSNFPLIHSRQPSSNGRAFRRFDIIDEPTRVYLSIDVARRLEVADLAVRVAEPLRGPGGEIRLAAWGGLNPAAASAWHDREPGGVVVTRG